MKSWYEILKWNNYFYILIRILKWNWNNLYDITFTDVDECNGTISPSPCPDTEDCHNTIGSHMCTCKDGYERIGNNDCSSNSNINYTCYKGKL